MLPEEAARIIARSEENYRVHGNDSLYNHTPADSREVGVKQHLDELRVFEEWLKGFADAVGQLRAEITLEWDSAPANQPSSEVSGDGGE